MQETQINSFLNKVRRTRVRGAESQLADLTGMELSGGYQVASQLPVASGEADIYTASKDDKEFILKYHRGITEISSEFWLEDSIPARLAAAKEAARNRVPELAKLLGAPKTAEENRLSRGYLHILDKSWPQRIFIGKTITFGSWYQNNAQEKTPLEWCCIGKRGNAAVLMSVKILCFRPWCKAQIHNISQDDFSEHRMRA
ncbi:MAG: hypothetical protein VZR11_07495 [Succinimonas sp.]|nr:hypothetical protein [Succinimonas sp.]